MIRTLRSKAGAPASGGRCSALPLGMGGYLMAPVHGGPGVYPAHHVALSAIAALLALVFLKEHVSLRAWGGPRAVRDRGHRHRLHPPEGAGGGLFYLGIAFAFLAAFGWAAEGVCATSGMDFIEPAVALNVLSDRVQPALRRDHRPAGPVAFERVRAGLRHPRPAGPRVSSPGVGCFALAGVVGCISYAAGTRPNMAGVSRAMALNITYALWGVLFSALFTDVEITRSLVIGGRRDFAGMFLVIGNPRDIINLRNVSS